MHTSFFEDSSDSSND